MVVVGVGICGDETCEAHDGIVGDWPSRAGLDQHGAMDIASTTRTSATSADTGITSTGATSTSTSSSTSSSGGAHWRWPCEPPRQVLHGVAEVGDGGREERRRRGCPRRQLCAYVALLLPPPPL